MSFRLLGLSQSGQYRTGDRFSLIREMKYFGIGQYWCTISGLMLYKVIKLPSFLHEYKKLKVSKTH